MKIYGDSNSGNCLKVKWVCDRLALPYDWVAIDTLKGESRTTEFLKLNGAGQVPMVAFDDGRTLAQSNAIIRYLARDSDLIPADEFAAAKMDEWLFWEQYSHEPYIAVCRFQMLYLGKPASDLDPLIGQREAVGDPLHLQAIAGIAVAVDLHASRSLVDAADQQAASRLSTGRDASTRPTRTQNL